MAWTPQLAGHQVVAPGVSKWQHDDITEYMVVAAAPACAGDGRRRRCPHRGQPRPRSSPTARPYASPGVPEATVEQSQAWAMSGRARGGAFRPDLRGRQDYRNPSWARRGRSSAPGRTEDRAAHVPPGRAAGWFAGWADDHAISKGTPAPQFAFALALLAGRHEVEVSE